MKKRITQPVHLANRSGDRFTEYPIGTQVTILEADELGRVCDNAEAMALIQCRKRMQSEGAVVVFAQIGEHVACMELSVFRSNSDDE